ncbi:MAG: hypothetical protein V4548_03845 [Bacteroidota bacterium]
MKNTISIFFMFFGIMVFAQNDFNKLDEKGNKHGLWKGVYEVSKRPRYEGNFEHGKEAGVFTFYDDTALQSVIATREFNKNDASAYTTFFDQKKNIVSEGKVVNKLHDGTWKYYHEASKVIMTLENYKNGKLEGVRSVYFPTGNIAEETTYVNGVKEGVYRKYAENGIILEDTAYKKGEFHGMTTYKDAYGDIVAKGLFKDGKKVGIWDFFEKGKKVKSENFNFQQKKFKKRDKVLPEPDQY